MHQRRSMIRAFLAALLLHVLLIAVTWNTDVVGTSRTEADDETNPVVVVELVDDAILEALKLLQWYARNHTLACVVPALFIAGGITTFLSQAAVMRYLGPESNKFAAYSVASIAGVVLAVCSCSVLPMFAGIYNLGAGLGPASAFLY